jgi:hypothetical protein
VLNKDKPPCKSCGDRWCANPDCDVWFSSTSPETKLCPTCRFKPEIRERVAKMNEASA